MKRIYEKDCFLGNITDYCYDIRGARIVARCFKRVMPHSKIHVRRGHIVVAVCKNEADFFRGLQFVTKVMKVRNETKIKEARK